MLWRGSSIDVSSCVTLADQIRRWAHDLRRDALALWFAARDPATPLFAKIIAIVVAAYAFSPIDLIPDFIPVLGLLDDLVLVPLGIALVLRLIPPADMARHRAAADLTANTPRSWAGAAIVVTLWIAGLVWLGWILLAVD